ncbi:MAG TPA: ABC transporter ATP-binding protein, partial [Negativicutes bacterium]|nr:ABC transporter ATP-binding protein [Negativicutes bacterium]
FGEGDEKLNVLDGVSVEINEGEFVSVMGPSGSGKSTLLFALSGMDGVDSGKVVFGGRELSKVKENELSDIRRTKMGFVFQQPTMLKNLNILDNIILPSMSGNKKKVREISEKAVGIMKKAGIAELEKRDITQVSGGQLQRAGICRALMNNPEIIFGDEPTGALNSKSAEEIMDVFSGINSEGTAVMLVTHDAKIAARTERILFMMDGKIVNELKLPKFDSKDLDDRIEKVTVKMREIGI